MQLRMSGKSVKNCEIIMSDMSMGDLPFLNLYEGL